MYFLSIFAEGQMDKQVLYISYDGMTDPLGQSQVIPYLAGLSKAGYRITLLSCEKREKFRSQGAAISSLLEGYGIQWEHVFFTSFPPILSKYYDLGKLRKKAFRLHRLVKFSMVHCRSYVAADVGYSMKKQFGIKFLFDIRGFWVDERVDGGLWDLKNPVYRRAYKTYKKKEADYVSSADTIVSLTENGKAEMEKWPSWKKCPIDVIPCCADYDLFTLQERSGYESAKEKLGFTKKDFVVSYLGSLGTWYMLEEMLDFFKVLQEKKRDAVFLFVSNGEEDKIMKAVSKKGIVISDIKIVNGKRNEVPSLIRASDISLSFIKPCYSKKSSSPTKLGELLAMGIPVICNSGIGDVDEIIHATNGGLIMSDLSISSYVETATRVDDLIERKDAAVTRERSKKYYDLAEGVNKYRQIYERLIG
ncbi:MAG: glycosyltransferase [Bacteroidia bacterium]